MAKDEYEEYEFIDDAIWDKALDEPYKYPIQRVVDLSEKYIQEAQDPRFRGQPSAIMEYTSQMWLWEALFPAEKDAFPGVYPRKKLPARPTGNAPNTQTVTAANTGVTNNATTAHAVRGTPTPKIPPSTGGPSSFANTAGAAHANTGSHAKMEIKNKPAQVPRKVAPNLQNKLVPNNPGRFHPSSLAMLPLVCGYPQFAVKSNHKYADNARRLFFGYKGEAVREVQRKLRARLRYLEVDDKEINKKVLVFYAEPFEKKDEKNAEVLYRCLAAWKFLTMWMGRYTEKTSLDYLHHYYREWENTSQGGEEITDEEWAKYVSLSPSLAGLKPSNKKPASVKAPPAVASAAEEHHAKEYQKVRRKVIEKYWSTSEEDMKSLIQRDFKWNLISRTYVRKTLTEQDMEAANLFMSGSVVGEGEGGSGKGKEKEEGNGSCDH